MLNIFANVLEYVFSQYASAVFSQKEWEMKNCERGHLPRKRGGGGEEARKTENAMVVRSYETSGKSGRITENNSKDRRSWTLLVEKL